MLNMQKIQFSLNNSMIRIIENGVAADLRKTEATSDLQQTTHEEIKIFSTFLYGKWRITSQEQEQVEWIEFVSNSLVSRQSWVPEIVFD